MQSNSDPTECPFCGGAVDDLTEQQIDLLRTSLLHNVMRAFLHDTKCLFASLSIGHHRIGHMLTETPSNHIQVAECLSQTERHLHILEHHFRMVGDLFRATYGDLIDIRNLPLHIRWILDSFRFGCQPDVSVFKEADEQIRGALYDNTLLFAVHATMISICRDRGPNIDLAFQIRNGNLSTAIHIHHHDELDTNTTQWQCFRIMVKRAEGISRTTTSENSTSVEWSIPLVAGAQA